MCHLFSVFMCDTTHSYVWHDSFICVTWLIHTWHDSFTWTCRGFPPCHLLSYLTRLIHMCEMTHSCVWHDPVMCATWTFHTWNALFILNRAWIELILPQPPAFIHVSMSYVCVTCVWRHTLGVTWLIYIEWSVFSIIYSFTLYGAYFPPHLQCGVCE